MPFQRRKLFLRGTNREIGSRDLETASWASGPSWTETPSAMLTSVTDLHVPSPAQPAATSDRSWLCMDRPCASHWDPELCLSVSSYSIDASEIADLHVISYEVERDLIPLILSNCQYHVERGGETLQEFDLEKIQRQIISRFLQGKPRLTLKARLTCCIDVAHVSMVHMSLVCVSVLQKLPQVWLWSQQFQNEEGSSGPFIHTPSICDYACIQGWRLCRVVYVSNPHLSTPRVTAGLNGHSPDFSAIVNGTTSHPHWTSLFSPFSFSLQTQSVISTIRRLRFTNQPAALVQSICP